MSARVRYVPDRASTGRWLLADRDLGRVLREKAERGAAYARRIAPRRTGAYADSIRVEPGPVVTDGLPPRQSVRVVAEVDYAGAVEWGRRRRGATRPHRVLQRTVDIIENSD